MGISRTVVLRLGLLTWSLVEGPVKKHVAWAGGGVMCWRCGADVVELGPASLWEAAKRMGQIGNNLAFGE